MTVDVARFHGDGFLAFDRLIGTDDVRAIGAAFDTLLADNADTDRMLGGVTRQILLPCRYHATFRENAALSAGREIARQLLGTDAPKFVYDQLLYKPPRHLVETPWHQDLAYFKVPFLTPRPYTDSSTVQFWVALDDVDASTGCMHFIPRKHERELFPHRVASGDESHDSRLLEIVEPERYLDLSEAIACPMQAGGATVHGETTPHFTSANTSHDRRRRAYIFNFAKP